MRHKNRYKIVQIYEEMDRKIRSGSILFCPFPRDTPRDKPLFHHDHNITTHPQYSHTLDKRWQAQNLSDFWWFITLHIQPSVP